MGLSKTEVNLKRLIAAASQQENQAKLIHYVATMRELLEQLAEERTPEGLPRVSKAKVSEYSEKIEAIAAKVAVSAEPQESLADISNAEAHKAEEKSVQSPTGSVQSPTGGLRRRFGSSSNAADTSHDKTDADQSSSLKIDDAARTHIDKHRKLQESLTDEMVVLARQLKESSLMMNQSIKNTEKILDSTSQAVEHSLASTGHANTRAMEVYSHSFKTTCFTWLMIFAMTCIFIMVVLLIRVT